MRSEIVEVEVENKSVIADRQKKGDECLEFILLISVCQSRGNNGKKELGFFLLLLTQDFNP